MGTEDNGDMRFQHRDGDDMLNCPSSVMNSNPLSDKVVGMTMSSDSMFKASNGAVPYFSSGWDPLVSLSQSENFGAHSGFSNAAYPVVLENQAISSTSHLVHYQPDSGLGEMMPKLSCFGSGSFSEMVNSFGLPECGRMNYSQNKEGGTGKALITGTHSEEECRSSEDKSSPNGKKKRRTSESHSPFNSNKVKLSYELSYMLKI